MPPSPRGFAAGIARSADLHNSRLPGRGWRVGDTELKRNWSASTGTKRWTVAAIGNMRGHAAGAIDDYLAFRTRLRTVLRGGSAQELGAFLRASGTRSGDPDLAAMGLAEELEELLHQLVLADVELADRHAASRTWLRARGRPVPPASRGYGQPNLRDERLRRSA
jgi:hypothetical protein